MQINFYFPNISEYHISDSIWEEFKKVEPIYSKQSCYYDNMIVWALPDNLESSTIRNYLHIVFNNVQQKDIDEMGITNKVWDNYITLFNRSFFDIDNELYSDNEVLLGFKRPFGNSHVIGDVAQEMERDVAFMKTKTAKQYLLQKNDEGYADYTDYYVMEDFKDSKSNIINPSKINEQEFFDGFYKVMVEIIQKYSFKYHNFDVFNMDLYNKNILNFSNHQLENELRVISTMFIPSVSEFRDEVIDDLLEN